MAKNAIVVSSFSLYWISGLKINIEKYYYYCYNCCTLILQRQSPVLQISSFWHHFMLLLFLGLPPTCVPGTIFCFSLSLSVSPNTFILPYFFPQTPQMLQLLRFSVYACYKKFLISTDLQIVLDMDLHTFFSIAILIQVPWLPLAIFTWLSDTFSVITMWMFVPLSWPWFRKWFCSKNLKHGVCSPPGSLHKLVHCTAAALSAQMIGGTDEKTLSYYYSEGRILLEHGCSLYGENSIIKKVDNWNKILEHMKWHSITVFTVFHYLHAVWVRNTWTLFCEKDWKAFLQNNHKKAFNSQNSVTENVVQKKLLVKWLSFCRRNLNWGKWRVQVWRVLMKHMFHRKEI